MHEFYGKTNLLGKVFVTQSNKCSHRNLLNQQIERLVTQQMKIFSEAKLLEARRIFADKTQC